MREPKGREDRCDKKESREKNIIYFNAPNMNYFPKIHFFLILQLWLAPFFNFSPLSDLNYNLPQISGKIGFFGIFPRFFFKRFFHQHRKTKFRRKIGRNFRNFCPCLQLTSPSISIGNTHEQRKTIKAIKFCYRT